MAANTRKTDAMKTDNYFEKGSLMAYDGELIPAADAMTRYERDKKIEAKYEEAEAEAGQMTFEQVKERLSE